MISFGERCLCKPLKKSGERQNKMEVRYEYGVYLGTSARTGELYMGTPEGVIQTRSIRRLSEGAQWDGDALEKITGTPWAPINGQRDQPVPIRIPATQVLAGVDVPPNPMAGEAEVRRVTIRKEDVEKHGATPGCLGCRAIQHNRQHQAHSSDCRARIEK